MRIDCLRGGPAMTALLAAFEAAQQDFELGVMVAAPTADQKVSIDYHLIFTIADTVVALTPNETRWLGAVLINQPPGSGQRRDDYQRFGRTLLGLADEAPGPHGVH